MAKENVKKFLEEISTNKDLQEKFLAAQQGYEAEGKSEEEIFEDIVLPVAKEAGYEFTMSEYKNAQREAMAEKGIREEELENVSGGISLCLVFGFDLTYSGEKDNWGACLALGVKRNEYTGRSETTGGLGYTCCDGFGVGLGGNI